MEETPQVELFWIITQKPTEETEGWVDLAYGEFETFEASAKFNFPITDNLYAKLTAFTIDQGEGFENVTLNRDQWKRCHWCKSSILICSK